MPANQTLNNQTSTDQVLSGKLHHVTDFLGHSWSFECMGCAIANGDLQLPGGIIYDNDPFILGTDPLIPIPGFLIITAKRHVQAFSDLTPTELTEAINLLVRTEQALRSLGITEFTIVQEERSPHFHIWIFPTYDWMKTQFGTGVSHLRDICDYAHTHTNATTINETLSIAEQVRTYFQNL